MKKLLLTLAVAGLTTLNAHAAEIEFASVDTDVDGFVSIDEVLAAGIEWTEEQYFEGDVDEDGMLNEEEFVAMQAK